MKMHYSVLKNELIESLNIVPDGVYIDCTIGYAGDANEILKRIPNGFLYGFDQDERAVSYSTDVLKKIGSNFKIFNTNFVNLEDTLDSEDILLVDGIIFDLGFSSPQIDDEERGFSFMHDGPLDMRMSSSGKSAKDVIDNYSEEKLTEIFFKYGEEKLSKVIARGIKKSKNINTTLELVDVIKRSVGSNYFYKQHPERKIFQALRIEVNDELGVLESVLPVAIKHLKKGGRLSVITFHSLEDRIVKEIFKEVAVAKKVNKRLPQVGTENLEYQLVNRKPVLASSEELENNNRAHSAKLRGIEKKG